MSCPVGQDQAEKNANGLAKDILNMGRLISKLDVTRVLEELFNTKTPFQQDRFSANPPGKQKSVGGVLGAVRPLGKSKVALKARKFNCDVCRDIALLLNTYRDQQLDIRSDSQDAVRPTSIQINFNFQGDLHVDGNNFGPSDIEAFGSFSQGALLVEAPDGDVFRELVIQIGGSGVAAERRTPGVYRLQRVDISKRMQRFNGASHLHCAEAFQGNRYSVVWFSLSVNELVKPWDADVLQDLRSMGFRPRSPEEVIAVPKAALSNDQGRYPPGFLFYCRHHRPGIESVSASSDEASKILRECWDELRQDHEDNEHCQCYWQRLESIARRPRRPRSNKNHRQESIVRTKIEQVKPSDEAGTSQSNSAFSSSAAPSLSEVIEVEDEAFDDADVSESAEDEETALLTLAEHVLVEFPQALAGTDEAFELLLKLLTLFGFEGEETRSKAYQFIEDKRLERSDRAKAERMQRNLDMGRAASFESESPLLVEDSQITLDSTPAPDSAGQDVGEMCSSPSCAKRLRMSPVGTAGGEQRLQNSNESTCSTSAAHHTPKSIGAILPDHAETPRFDVVEEEHGSPDQDDSGIQRSMEVSMLEATVAKDPGAIDTETTVFSATGLAELRRPLMTPDEMEDGGSSADALISDDEVEVVGITKSSSSEGMSSSSTTLSPMKFTVQNSWKRRVGMSNQYFATARSLVDSRIADNFESALGAVRDAKGDVNLAATMLISRDGVGYAES